MFEYNADKAHKTREKAASGSANGKQRACEDNDDNGFFFERGSRSQR